jgi:hypothetical protein
MKNVQVIDHADNCMFPIFQFTEQQFALVFQKEAQDIAFIDEVLATLSDEDAALAFEGVWDRPIPKSEIDGLHGTLLYGFERKRQYFPASRRECDWDDRAVNPSQRLMNARARASRKA